MIVEENCDRFIKLSVIDTGIGIPKEQQAKLFKLFGFIQSSAQMNTNGIGLGLVISDQIVSKFDGMISFDSKFGEGSVFSFTFKLSKDNNPQMMIENSSGLRQENDDFECDSHTLVFKWVPSANQDQIVSLSRSIEYVQGIHLDGNIAVQNLPVESEDNPLSENE